MRIIPAFGPEGLTVTARILLCSKERDVRLVRCDARLLVAETISYFVRAWHGMLVEPQSNSS